MNVGETWKCKINKGFLHVGKLCKISHVSDIHVIIFVGGEAQMSFTKNYFLDCFWQEKP